MKKIQGGFVLPLVVVIVVLASIGVGAYILTNKKTEQSPTIDIPVSGNITGTSTVSKKTSIINGAAASKSNELNSSGLNHASDSVNFNGVISFTKMWPEGEGSDIKNIIVTKIILDENLIGTLEADGYQTYERYNIRAVLKKVDSIDIFYESLLDKDSMGLYKKDEYLFSVDFINGKYLFRKNDNFNELSTGDVGEFILKTSNIK